MMKLKSPFSEKTFSAVSLIVIGAAILFVIAATLYYIQQERQRDAIEDATSKTNELILEVRKIAEQDRNYSYCNAVLVAKYTQDQQPIVIEDLDRCVFKSFPRGSAPTKGVQSNAQTFLAPQNALTPSATQQSSTTPIQPASPVQPVTPTNPNAPTLSVPNLLQVTTPCIEAFGIIRTC